MAKHKISDDPTVACAQMARELANNSIVNKALARYIEQILEAVNEDTIQPLRDEIERLQTALDKCQKALAVMIDPSSIGATTVLSAFAMATEAEACARAALSLPPQKDR
jgi:hypothetical protein